MAVPSVDQVEILRRAVRYVIAIERVEDVQGTWVRVDSEVSDAAIVAVPVRAHLHSERSQIVEMAAREAMNRAKAKIAVIIRLDVDCGHWP